MKNLLYQAVKISIGVITAIFLASLFHLNYITTAGVITMLSILESRRQSLIVGLKRFTSAIIAILISTLLFTVGGHTLAMLGLFLFLFIPLGVYLKTSEGLTVSTVLVTHIFSINSLSSGVVINEIYLLVIGVLVAWALHFHMPNTEADIIKLQKETEKLMIAILNNMALQLLNQCSIAEQKPSFHQLRKTIEKGYKQGINFNNNSLLKDNSYYIHYFTMREEQERILSHMEKHFNIIFIATKQAKPLSDLTKGLANQFDQWNDGSSTLKEAEKLQEHYKSSPLPTSREEFEHRAILFQYMSDLLQFVEVKKHFMKEHRLSHHKP